jgi:hypothetical protein
MYSEMPLLERSDEIEGALNALKTNEKNIKSKSKQRHAFYAILAGTGSGKSRLCDEIILRVDEEYGSMSYCIKIDFSNGDKIQAIESIYPTYMLGLRVAARLLFNLSTAELINYLNGLYSPIPFEVFGFEEVMEAFYKHRNKLGNNDLVYVVLAMDEINYVPLWANLFSMKCWPS